MTSHDEFSLSPFGEKVVSAFSALDKTPLKHMASGYWVEKYGLKAKQDIEEFEQRARGTTAEGLEYLTAQYEGRIKKHTRSAWLGWTGTFFPATIAMMSYASPKLQELNTTIQSYIENPFLAQATGAGAFLIGAASFATLFHDFACPSSIRKYLKYKEQGDDRMCNILYWAGFSPKREFQHTKKSLEKKLETQASCVSCTK